MVRPSDTRQRIQQVARELFAEKGVQRTSLQEIANRLDITKPALYYHFSSREELLRSIVQPLIDDGVAMIDAIDRRNLTPRELLTAYFTFFHRQRHDLYFILGELSTLSDLGLIQTVASWRRRVMHELVGPEPSLAESTRAIVALGGLQDCALEFADLDYDELAPPAVDAACSALGID